ncbi:MAG: DUF4097 family beta strand repeat-containing protein [Defluviitaleaceae bacterium]|nr:DUF4097 family beta strand repeat-containing protein [Defluviitaleaceae bacterium]
MPDNKLDILQRLEAGEITAEEALAMMNQQPPTPTHPTAPPSHHMPNPIYHRQANQNQPRNFDHYTPPPHQEQGWAEGLFDWVGELVDDITSSIKDMDIGVNISDALSGNYSHNERRVNFVSKPILQGLTQLELHGKNDKIEIQAYEGDCVQIQCHYDARYPEAYVQFHEENGCIAIMFDEKQMRSVQILCQVPKAHIGHVIAATKNGRISVYGLTAGNIELVSKNEKILIEAISCTSLTAHTTNDNIKAKNISATDIILETTNAKITAEDIQAQALAMITTNSTIKTFGLDVVRLHMKTTNAGLKLEESLFGNSPLFWEGERSIEAYTTNSGLKLALPEGVGLSVDASASGGKVNCEVPLYGAEGNKNHVVGESINFPSSGRRLRAKLHTTNATLRIRGM